MGWTYHIYTPMEQREAKRLVEKHQKDLKHFVETHVEVAQNADRCGDVFVADYYLFEKDKGLYLKEAPGFPRIYLSELVQSSVAPNQLEPEEFERLKACRTALAIDKPAVSLEGKLQVSQVLSLLAQVGEGAYFDAGQFQVESKETALDRWRHRSYYQDFARPLTLRPLKLAPPKQMSAAERISDMIESVLENPETLSGVREWMNRLDASEQNFVQTLLDKGDLGMSVEEKPMAEKLLQELTALVVNE
jgi:hypothetical protein